MVYIRFQLFVRRGPDYERQLDYLCLARREGSCDSLQMQRGMSCLRLSELTSVLHAKQYLLYLPAHLLSFRGGLFAFLVVDQLGLATGRVNRSSKIACLCHRFMNREFVHRSGPRQ